jgi:hypothetical protein
MSSTTNQRTLGGLSAFPFPAINKNKTKENLVLIIMITNSRNPENLTAGAEFNV